MARFWPCGGPIRFSCFQHCWAGLAGLYGPCPFGRHRSLSQTADQGPPAPGEAVGVPPSSSPSVSNFHFKSHCPRIRSASSTPLQTLSISDNSSPGSRTNPQTLNRGGGGGGVGDSTTWGASKINSQRS